MHQYLVIIDIAAFIADSAFPLALGCPWDVALCSNSDFRTKRLYSSELNCGPLPLINLLYIPYLVKVF